MTTRRRAFSRCETLLLGSTLLLGGALLWPVWAQEHAEQKGRQRAALCQTNLRKLAAAMIQYTQDWDEKYLPPVGSSRVEPVMEIAHDAQGNKMGVVLVSNYGWADALKLYYWDEERSLNILQCPSEPTARIEEANQTGFTDYWINRNLSGLVETNLNDTSRTILFGDGGNEPTTNARYSHNNLPKSWRTLPNSPARRHLGMANYAFADGHVAARKPEQISTKPGDPNTFAP